MKRLLALLLSLALIFAFTGCKDDEDKLLEGEEILFDVNSTTGTSAEVSSNTDTSSDTSASEGDTSSEQSSSTDSSSEEGKLDTGMNLIQSGGLYFPDINSLFEVAEEIYSDLVHSTFSYDKDLGVHEIKINGSYGHYWRVNDDRFDSVAELEAYLDALFTKECQKTFYDPKRFVDYKGHLYAVVGTYQPLPTYAGRSFKLTKQTTKRIFFEVTGYYYKTYEEIDTTKPLLTTAPEDPSIYNTKTVAYTMQVSEDGMGWRFTKFGLV